MKKKERYSKSDKQRILSEWESGKSLESINDEYGIDQSKLELWLHDATNRSSKAESNTLASKELARLRHLESENNLLRNVVADLHIQIAKKCTR